MSSCDITDEVQEFVDDYLSDYDWSDIEDELRRDIESEMARQVAAELKEFEISLAEKVGEAIDANSMIQVLKDEFEAKFKHLSNLISAESNGSFVTHEQFMELKNRGFFGRLKWLFFGV